MIPLQFTIPEEKVSINEVFRKRCLHAFEYGLIKTGRELKFEELELDCPVLE